MIDTYPALPPLNAQVRGNPAGEWVTFVPGIGNDADFWRRQAEALSERCRALTFDPWGQSASPAPPAECSFDKVLAGIVQLWDEFAVPRSHVVGLGFGGSVSLALALTYPDRVDRVVACCCRPRQPDNRRDFWRQRIAAAHQDMQALGNATVDRWLSEEFRHTHPELERELRAMIGRTRSEGYQAYVHAFIEMDFEAQLESITRPVMLIAAEHDHGGGPIEAMQAMQQKIPGSVFEVIRDSGHICNYERPERVTELIRGFLG